MSEKNFHRHITLCSVVIALSFAASQEVSGQDKKAAVIKKPAQKTATKGKQAASGAKAKVDPNLPAGSKLPGDGSLLRKLKQEGKIPGDGSLLMQMKQSGQVPGDGSLLRKLKQNGTIPGDGSLLRKMQQGGGMPGDGSLMRKMQQLNTAK